MILIKPLPLLPTQQLHIDQLPTHWHHGHMLEPQVRLVPKMMPRLRFLRHDDVFDPDAKVAVFVVARLIGQDVAGRESNLAVLKARAHPNGTFVDVEVGSHAMPGAVPVIEALRPEELASEGVESEASRTLWEHGGVESDDAFEDQGVRFPLHVRRGAEMQGSRRVGRAVEVLSARVAEVDGLGVDDGAVARFGLVVDDGGVGPGAGDGVEGEAGEIVLGSGAVLFQMMILSIRSLMTYARMDSSLSAACTSSSTVPFSTSSSSSHAKYSLSAAPSRT